jgi:hypothetical protein
VAGRAGGRAGAFGGVFVCVPGLAAVCAYTGDAPSAMAIPTMNARTMRKRMSGFMKGFLFKTTGLPLDARDLINRASTDVP